MSLYEEIKAQQVSSRDVVYTFLRKAILRNYVGRGCRLVERDLAQDLGISRTPVREAFRQLEAEGLVKHNANKGVVVTGISYTDISEIYGIRAVLEGFAARLAAQKASPEELDELEKLLRQGQADAARGVEGNNNFHTALIKASCSIWLERLVNPLREYIESFHLISFLREGRREEAFLEHMMILSALRDRDADLAERLVKEHISNSHTAFRKAVGLL